LLVIPTIFIDLLAAFVVGGAWITLTTLIAETHGSTIGGLIGGLPSTAALSLLFIGITQSSAAAVQASTVTPLVYGFTGVFLAEYALLSKRNSFYVSLLVSLALWSVLATLVVLFGIDNFALSLAGGIALITASYFLMKTEVRTPSVRGAVIHYSGKQVAARAFASGFVIASAVALSKIGGPIFGGLFSMVPVVYTSTLVITNKSRGKEFTRHLVMPLMLSGAMSSMVTYIPAVRYFYPTLGVLPGTLASYLVSLVAIYAVYRLTRNSRAAH
jgi:uncharacterized membrane protein (GlpM family)